MRWSLIVSVAALVGTVRAEAGIPSGQQAARDAGRASPSAAAAKPAPASETWAFRPDQLIGPDERLGALAALTLLQATAGDEPEKRAYRARHREYVRSQLDPLNFADESAVRKSFPGARRIVQAIETLTASSGPPFKEAPDLLLSMLGLGPQSLRSAVVNALVAMIGWEEAQRPQGVRRVKEEIVRRILHNPPPGETVIVDASRVLWRSDGKLFLSTAIAGMQRNGERYPSSVELYLGEIRRRLRIDFSTTKDWASWWEQQKKKSLPEIFADCQRRVSEESARHWQQTIKRLRETQDAERVLSAVQETLVAARALELRLAAVAQLGDFASWVRDVKMVDEKENGAPLGDPRDRLLARAFVLLLDAAEGKTQPHERPQVRRAAVVAMRRYQPFLERHRDLVARASELLLQRFEALRGYAGRLDFGERRSDLIEVLRTAGALGLPGAREPAEAFLRDSRESDDLEVLATAAAALGRLVKSELKLETARLLFSLFAIDAEPSRQSQIRALRRACVVALNARPGSEVVRDEVRSFFREILKQGEGELRIPAILGLGTLARDKDREALGALVNVVALPKSFTAQEIIAALDAIAYVGGQEALAQFSPLLGARDELVQKDKAVYDHLWRKVVGLVKADTMGALPAVSTKLEQLAVERDSTLFLECAIALCREPELKQILSSEGLDLGDEKRLRALWVTTLIHARAFELLGRTDEDPPEILKLVELQRKNPQIQQKIPDEVAQLRSYVEGKEKRAALRERLSAEGFEPVAALEEIMALLDGARAIRERWFAFSWVEKQLATQLAGPDERAGELVGRWIDALNSEAKANLFQGFPDGFKARYIERFEALKSSAKVKPSASKSGGEGGSGGEPPAPPPKEQ